MELECCNKLIYESRPEVKFCDRYTNRDSKWNYSVHDHPCMELIYTLNGIGETEVSGERHRLSVYDMILYPAYVKHQNIQVAEEEQEIFCLWIELPELELEEAVYLRDREHALGTAFQRVYSEVKRENPDPYLLEYEVKYLLTLIFREQNEASADAPWLNGTLHYIEEHLSEKITLDMLAEKEHISKSYLSRKFKESTGETVITYINQKRIEAAAQKLIFTDADIDEISFGLGFESAKYFHRVFKKQRGVSPASFRRKYKIKR